MLTTITTLDPSTYAWLLDAPVSRIPPFLWSIWDGLVTEITFRIFEYLSWKQIRYPSETTKDLPLVKTPTMIVTCIIVYLFVIAATFFKRSLFPEKCNGVVKADPPALRILIFFHNVFLVALSIFMFVGTVYQAVKNEYSLLGNMVNPDETGMAYMLYIFYLSKIYEFTDTFIMLLKGNIHQVSFLHVYHHVSISFVWWFLVYSSPGGDIYYTCALNSFVHILMYTYYLLTLIVGKDSKKRAKYLWWGRYMTLLQIAQFVSITTQSIYSYFFTEFPKFLAVSIFVYMQTLLLLFVNFYLRNYVLKSNTKTKLL